MEPRTKKAALAKSVRKLLTLLYADDDTREHRLSNNPLSEMTFKDVCAGDVFVRNGKEMVVISRIKDIATLVPLDAEGMPMPDAPQDRFDCDEYTELEDYVDKVVFLATPKQPIRWPKEKQIVKFDDVILSSDKKQLVIDAIQQVDNHKLIFEDWGFGEVFEKGTAISMLFYGPPGTGKTLMAQAIADKYNYKLKVISTAEIESSEPGQAERNIKAYFEAAEKDKKMVLLFDECDSLINDRAGVGMILAAQINQLLSSLENYTGIAIFTTNMIGKLDPAFERRLSLKLEFDMPDAEHREKIWKRMFPKKAPLDAGIRWDRLATVEIAGGHIKNIVLRAARAAASSDKKTITEDMLVQCLKEEVTAADNFQAAVAGDRTPKMIGGGSGYQRTAGISKTQAVQKGN